MYCRTGNNKVLWETHWGCYKDTGTTQAQCLSNDLASQVNRIRTAVRIYFLRLVYYSLCMDCVWLSCVADMGGCNGWVCLTGWKVRQSGCQWNEQNERQSDQCYQFEVHKYIIVWAILQYVKVNGTSTWYGLSDTTHSPSIIRVELKLQLLMISIAYHGKPSIMYIVLIFFLQNVQYICVKSPNFISMPYYSKIPCLILAPYMPKSFSSYPMSMHLSIQGTKCVAHETWQVKLASWATSRGNRNWPFLVDCPVGGHN